MPVFLKYAVIVLLFFLCAILQVSLLPYVSITGAVPNLLFIVFFAALFFQKKQDVTFGFTMAVVAGFLLDIITPLRFGVSIVILLAVYFIYRGLIRFFQEADANTLIWYFLGIFLALFLVYYALLYVASKLIASPIQTGASTVGVLAYSLVLAAVIFFVWQTFFGKRPEDNQLKLL